MSERETDYGREVRDTVIKSSMTGVAATVMAVAVFSPAGLGGMIGTSVASGAGAGNTSPADDPYANLPPFPAPLTSEEISDIRGQLASTAASLEITRAATEARIQQMRALTVAAPVVSPPAQVHAPVIEARATPLNENAQVAHDGGDPAYRDRHQQLASLLLNDTL